MTRQEIQNYFEKIAKSLEQKRLKQAFDLLSALFSHLQNWQLQEKFNSLQDTYKMMLSYLTEGVKDPGREKVYNDLVHSIYQIADAVILQIKTSNDNSFFYEKRRAYRFLVPETSHELIAGLEDIFGKIALLSLLDEEEKNRSLKDLEKQKELLSRKVFYNIWLSDLWTSDEKDRWTTILNNQLDTAFFPSLIVTGITLNLLETFDEKKAALLFEAAHHESAEIRERALTGIVLFLRKYNDRLYLYPGITERLNLLAENPKFIHQIRHILLQFILSRETEKITKKIKDELFPEMMKMGPKLGAKIKPEDFMSEAGMDDKNPEWQDLIEEAGLKDKLQELSELQMEGADVMHSSFIHLKNYPFFNEPVNWFIPFTIPSDAIGNTELTQLSNVLTASTMLCNSDKYSFFLSVSQMPENYRKMMISQFSMETKAVKEALKEDLQDSSKTIDHRTRQYIQDLYRFYKLHPRRKDFEDIFEIQPEFYKVPFINQLIKDNESLLIIGEYYFNRNYFEEAADIYSMLLQTDPNNDILYQKKGYCLQMTGHLQQALEHYQKAELLNANSSWTIKKLAYCHRILKQPEEALHYYKKAEQLNPDNLSVQLNIGHCYLELKAYDQALKYYFKIEYLTKNKEKAWRAIGWCSFLVGKYSQATDYFNRIIESNPNSTDYLNAGHVQLVTKNYKEALLLYKSAVEKGKHSQEEFTEIFYNDVPYLIDAGINEEDIPFILDSLMYSI
ncbi:MAG: tetratricopeptide repeat protein [Candidatus Symbiothrix sp.]|jgi:tetratricopeptide (TPR) repeat protein|nr:tetratricopeptide repeat protein [Candidatus Symbiothrix sp.]